MTDDDHATIWAYESAACEPTAWERWIKEVEALLGHDADGDQSTDGYSLDGFYEMWERGLTPATATESLDDVRGVASKRSDVGA